MKKAMFLLVPIMALFFASCGGSSSSTIENLEFPIAVDYSKSIKHYLKAGHYDYVNEDILFTSFSNDTKDTVISRTATLITFNRSMTSEDIVVQLKNRGFRPGTAQELYAFGALYPRLQGEFSIIALGSVSSDSCVPVLYLVMGGSRLAHLWSWFGEWNSDYRFLAFKD
ncbi:MAG: hypothetical protein KBB75_02695 [Candidatus Pacebacteria bacterium]|jgi:hypothetical protein|nr:hypothetical protein [Candidatus Paceibacterota bacterium]